MKRAAAVVVTALVLLPAVAGAQAADETFHQRVGRAHALAHQAEDAWTASRAERSESLQVDLFAFAGAARLAADRLSQHGLAAADEQALLANLQELANRAQASFDRTRTGSATRDAWAEARRALASLNDPASSTAPPAASRPVPPAETAPPVAATEKPVDPDAPRAVISETRWSGTFTPDLIVGGRLEGRGLRSGFLSIRDAGGREVHRVEREIADAITTATQGGPADALATAVFSVRIDDDLLASGENTLVLSVSDYRGRTVESVTKITKRLF